MNHIIEVRNYHLDLMRLFRDLGYSISNFNILRYFECATFGFRIRSGGDEDPDRRAEVAVLPRVEASSLRFEVNANVEGDDEGALEKILEEGFAEFFTREFAGGDKTAEFIKRHGADGIHPLFFVWQANLALHLGVRSS